MKTSGKLDREVPAAGGLRSLESESRDCGPFHNPERALVAAFLYEPLTIRQMRIAQRQVVVHCRR